MPMTRDKFLIGNARVKSRQEGLMGIYMIHAYLDLIYLLGFREYLMELAWVEIREKEFQYRVVVKISIMFSKGWMIEAL